MVHTDKEVNIALEATHKFSGEKKGYCIAELLCIQIVESNSIAFLHTCAFFIVFLIHFYIGEVFTV